MSPYGSDRSPRRPMRRKLLQALTAGLVLATATGCTYKDFPRLGMPTPTTEEAPRILSLWQGSWAAALATGVLVWGLILWSTFFHRRSRTKVEVPPQTRYNMPIEALYTVVPLIIVSVLFYFTARDESKLLDLSKKPDVTVNVVGFQWSWGFNYIENVPGSTGDATTDKNLAAIPDRFTKQFPANAGGVYDVGTPASQNPQTHNPGPTLWLPKGKT
ncbi:MAG: cytochrome c oxidase subunit, partial [Streptomyces sp.]|nr:cytochrome c oxidase subunit [Streptomyces sp.]